MMGKAVAKRSATKVTEKPLKHLAAEIEKCHEGALRGAEMALHSARTVACPSWPFRMGTNPFRERRVMTEEQRQAAAERLERARASKSKAE